MFGALATSGMAGARPSFGHWQRQVDTSKDCAGPRVSTAFCANKKRADASQRIEHERIGCLPLQRSDKNTTPRNSREMVGFFVSTPIF